MNVSVVSGLAFGPGGQRLDVYSPTDSLEARQPECPIVLLWHGRGPDERDVLAPLAMATAASGVVCVVPDWRPDAPDLGRTHLRESALFVQQHGGDFGGDVSRTTLAGWSLGGKTAVGAALDAAALDGWRPQAVVAIAGGYSSADPLTRQVAMDRLAGAGALAEPIPVHLVHGTADVLVDIERSRLLHAALRDRDWPCTLTELDGADHAGVVMTVYDPEARRCQATDAEHVLRAGHQTAQVIARAATSPSGP